MRLEIPDNLRPSLRALESVSFTLKKKHPGLKRNVKFDDEVLDLVLDINLEENGPWRKIRPERAMVVKLSLLGPDDDAEVDSAELQSMMSVGSGNTSGAATGANATPQGQWGRRDRFDFNIDEEDYDDEGAVSEASEVCDKPVNKNKNFILNIIKKHLCEINLSQDKFSSRKFRGVRRYLWSLYGDMAL